MLLELSLRRLPKAAEPKRHYQKIIRYDDDDRQMKLRSNTHGCELNIIQTKLFKINYIY